MLILTRKINESITLRTALGEAITITVTTLVSQGKVRLGIDAPDSVEILRTEILDRQPAEAAV